MADFDGFGVSTPSVSFGARRYALAAGFRVATPSVSFGGRRYARAAGFAPDPSGTASESGCNYHTVTTGTCTVEPLSIGCTVAP